MGVGQDTSPSPSWCVINCFSRNTIIITCIGLVNLNPQSQGNVLLLTTNTEVSIAPKLHRLSRGPTTTARSGLAAAGNVGTSLTKEANITEDAMQQSAQILRVLPQRIVHPCPEYIGSELTAYVSPSTFSHLKPLHKFSKDAGMVVCFQSTLSRLQPPVDPSLITSQSSPAPVPRILKPEASENFNHVDGKQDSAAGSVFVGWAEGVPDNHIVFPAFPDGVEEWDLVQ